MIFQKERMKKKLLHIFRFIMKEFIATGDNIMHTFFSFFFGGVIHQLSYGSVVMDSLWLSGHQEHDILVQGPNSQRCHRLGLSPKRP